MLSILSSGLFFNRNDLASSFDHFIEFSQLVIKVGFSLPMIACHKPKEEGLLAISFTALSNSSSIPWHGIPPS